MEEKNLEMLIQSGKVLLMLASLMTIGYIYDIKYGKKAEEKYKIDSIGIRHYQDSCYKAFNDSVRKEEFKYILK